MTITYKPCNFCGAQLVAHQADLTNSGAEGFECPKELEQKRRSEKPLVDSLVDDMVDTIGWDMDEMHDSDRIEEYQAEWLAKNSMFVDEIMLPENRITLKSMAKRIHKEAN